MQLQPEIIKNKRSVKGWTQQHLADACGVSLRTIQRVEKIGNVSQDTALGLASVLEVKLEELKMIPNKQEAVFEKVDLRTQFLILGLIFFAGLTLGAAIVFSWSM